MYEELESKSALEILKWAKEEFKNDVVLASSFGAEDVVLIDLWAKMADDNFKPRVFTLDTGRLPEETYKLMDKIREKYDIKLEIYYPDTKSVEEMLNKYGFNLFYKSIELRQLCCRIRKVEPLKRALKDAKAWICGLRREQSITRADIKKVEIDTSNNSIIKINPLSDWKEEEIWNYIKENKVPYNELHDKNYPSIGCEPCTRAVRKIEDVRGGRWWWEPAEKKECGLHKKG
ncbi:MAG TPA: phosphoadenylyl-sulfate reductase [bacterium]|nr:phosphoadenylyl-sulfate reductase [bacterium]HOL47110.1 phosphoadenylyl-sulfate reductase [bacterium]HPQ18864.1 phosphoadenylyl-sulfate reductase [bacterium]